MRILRTILIFSVLLAWLFSGWPPIQEAQAATLTYVGGAEASGNSAAFNVSLTGLTGGAGSAALVGDLVIVATGFVSTANGNPGVGTTGYTEAADLYSNDTRDANFSVNWKMMSGTPDTSVSCNGSGSSTNGAVCVVQVWRNVNTATPLDVTSTTATGTNSAVPNSPSITPITAGAVIIATGLGTGASADTSVTAPTGYGNKVDISVDPGNAATVGIVSKAWSGSGADDPAAWTGWTTTTSDGWAAVTLALRPAADLPAVTTQSASSVDALTATGNGTITATGGVNADARGFVYDTASHGLPGNVAPGSSGYASSGEDTGSFGTGAFTKGLAGLSAHTTYYVRVYAHNIPGYSYGGEVNFLTLPSAPTSLNFTSITETTLTVNWTAPIGGATSYKVERCTGSGCSDFSEITAGETGTLYNDSGLTTNTTYRYRVRATNATGDGAYATAAEATTQITVAVSVSVSDGVVTYGTLVPGATTSTITLSDTQTTTNDGNATETFNIKGQDTSCPWALVATAGIDQYIHEFSTNGGTNWTALTTSYQTLATGITVSGTRQIDLSITVPTESTCFTQQSVDVVIQAVQE